MRLRLFTTGLLAAVLGSITGCGQGVIGDTEADQIPDPVAFNALTGGGTPSGPHYNLNIIGVSNPKSTDMNCGNGGRIFVPLVGSTQIGLTEGSFAVLDCNGTDGHATFQLPNPDPNNTGTTTYSVFARALGKPGGTSTTTTCATDVATGELFCSVFQMVLVRDSGKQTFTNVSKELLFIFADTNGDGKLERFPLFDSSMQDFFWQYDNNGLRLAQLRFYQVPTTVQ
jgi:hypothetical protein